MKSKAAAFLAAIVGIVALGALLAPGASGEHVDRGAIVQNVKVTPAGTGTGTVTSSASSYADPISCPSDCNGTFQPMSQVTLTATPAAGSVFAGFTGITCVSGTNPCEFTVGSGVTNVTATFNLAPATPTDTDGDGVPDASDRCPSLPGPADNGGCPKYNPPAPVPPGDQACAIAKTKLAKAKEKLAKLKSDDASDAKIDVAKQKVKKAKKAAKKACAT